MRDVRWHKVELAVSLGATLFLLLLALAGPALQGWPGVTTMVAALLMILQPPALVRLLDHFRPVIPRELWTVVGGAALGLVALIVLPYPRPVAFLIALALFFGGVQGCVAWAVFTEAQRRAGITRHRLTVASVGMALATLLVLIEGFSWMSGARLPITVHLMLTLATGAC